MDIMEKKCSKCGEVKDIGEFGKDKTGKNGHAAQCKICRCNHEKKQRKTPQRQQKIKEWIENNKESIALKSKQYRELNIEKITVRAKEYYQEIKNTDKYKKQKKKYMDKYYNENKELLIKKSRTFYNENKKEISIKQKKYRKTNRTKLSESEKKWRHNNIDRVRHNQREWNKNNKDKSNANHRRYDAKKRKTDPLYKLIKNMRSRIHHVVKKQKTTKSKRTVELLGCTIVFFNDWLQNQFTKKMTWENYGSYWHIDHIRPLASFDLSKPEEQLKAFHYTNCQPLEAKKNLQKSDKWDGEQKIFFKD